MVDNSGPGAPSPTVVPSADASAVPGTAVDAGPTTLGEPAEVEATIDGDRRADAEAAARRRARLRRLGLQLLSLAVLLFVWWFVAERGIWSEVFVPKPSSVWARFVESVTTDDKGRPGLSGYYLWHHLWASFWRIVQGVGWAIVFGVALGLLLASVKPVRTVVEPYVNFIRALPPLAYFSLLIIWFGIEDTSKIWLLFLAAFAPITLSVVSGVGGIRHERIDAARSLGANRWQTLRFVVLPSVLPELFTGIRLALGFAWTTIVAAETVDGIPGIGGLAWSTKKFQQTDIAILCIITIGVAAVLLDQAVKGIERAMVPWRGKA